MSEGDWLDEGREQSVEALFDSERQRSQVQEDRRAAAIEFAQQYLVFESDERARALLEHWDKALLRRRTPKAASHQEYAADEAVRAFVDEIHRQIDLAHSR